jgi:hypothetical protein
MKAPKFVDLNKLRFKEIERFIDKIGIMINIKKD